MRCVLGEEKLFLCLLISVSESLQIKLKLKKKQINKRKHNFYKYLHTGKLTEKEWNSKKWLDHRLIYHLIKGKRVWVLRDYESPGGD
jgi:hypothetical protein